MQGVHGSRLNPNVLKREGKLTDVTMKRGRIGCYLSHMKVWQEIIKRQDPISFIMEDDVNITYNSNTSKRLQDAFEVLSKHATKWDIAYICHYPRGTRLNTPQNLFVEEDNGIQFIKTQQWHVLYGYAISLRGAQTVFNGALPINMAIDVYIGTMAKKGRIVALQLSPEICRAEYSGSDTEGIL
jgi:GR25 family glycosyltransferase involved in LPS biosynthesis